MLSTTTAAKGGVRQGDDGPGTLPLSKYGDWPCHPSLIWEARSLKFQGNRERGRGDLHVVLGDTGEEQLGKGGRGGSREGAGLLIRPRPADLGEQGRRQAVREGMPRGTGGGREITLYLYVRGGGRAVRNLTNPLSSKA